MLHRTFLRHPVYWKKEINFALLIQLLKGCECDLANSFDVDFSLGIMIATRFRHVDYVIFYLYVRLMVELHDPRSNA